MKRVMCGPWTRSMLAKGATTLRPVERWGTDRGAYDPEWGGGSIHCFTDGACGGADWGLCLGGE